MTIFKATVKSYKIPCRDPGDKSSVQILVISINSLLPRTFYHVSHTKPHFTGEIQKNLIAKNRLNLL